MSETLEITLHNRVQAWADIKNRLYPALARALQGGATWVLTIKPETRTQAQNRLMWPLLTAFSKSLQWPVDGRMVTMTTDEWKDVLMQDAKDAWARELGQYAGRLEAIAYALDSLPERAPNAVQFRNLCRAAPDADVPALTMPSANPARMREELAKLGHVTAAKVQTTTGMMDWAPRILAREAAGAKITPTVLGMAREVDALRVRRTA